HLRQAFVMLSVQMFSTLATNCDANSFRLRLGCAKLLDANSKRSPTRAEEVNFEWLNRAELKS
ncbi:MAG: hypothetical protein SQA66_13335, partial [Candidatus Fervidibacter sacchari]